MSSVDVFGAGASTEYRSVTGLPMPVDRSFWGIAETVIESPRIDPQEKLNRQKLVEALKKIYNVCYLRDLDRVGLEGVFSEISNRYPDNVFVYKLHGSLGWFSPESDENPVLYLSGPIEQRRLAIKGYLPGRLVLIPPIPKKVLPKSLSEIWGIAEEVLKKAVKIYFIGYRLPETDCEAREMFGRSCKDKPIELVLKWSEANGEIQRLKTLFPNLAANSFTSRKFSEWIKNA